MNKKTKLLSPVQSIKSNMSEFYPIKNYRKP